MAALPIGTCEANRASARPAHLLRPPQMPPGLGSAPNPTQPATPIAVSSLLAADARLWLQPTDDDLTSSAAALTHGLAAYRAQLAERVQYFGPATPLDLRV